MFNEGNRLIARSITKDDYLNLHLVLDSDQNVWQKAIGMFEERIRGRFFRQIDTMMDDLLENGFSVMALDCLLVETLLHFRTGQARTKGADYRTFLKEHILKDRSENADFIAGKFYKGIRCGILHSAETGKNIALTFSHPEAAEVRDGYLYVSVDRFTDQVRRYFDDYLWDLRRGYDAELRKAFLTRMNGLCRKDD